MSQTPSSQKLLWVHESSNSAPGKPGGWSTAIRQHVAAGKTKKTRERAKIQISEGTRIIAQEGWQKGEAAVDIDATNALSRLDIIVDAETANDPYQFDHKKVDCVTQPGLRRRRNSRIGAHPRLALFKGDSDPFNVYPVSITPQAKSIISFLRDVWLPADFLTSSENSIRKTVSRTEWTDVVQCLKSEGSAYAMLSMYATLLARRSSDDQAFRYSLHCKHQSIASLRSQLSEVEGTSDSFSVFAGISFLLGASICDDKMTEAEIHVRALKNLFDSKDVVQSNSAAVLLRALRFDVRLALVRLSPTIFDMEGHAQYLLRKNSIYAEQFFAALPSLQFISPMDYYLSEPVRSLIVKTRQAFWLWRQQKIDIDSREILILSHWVMGSHYIVQGCLINHFLEMKTQLRGYDKLNATKTALELCVSLGVLCVLNDPSMTGESTHDCTLILLGCLQELLIYIEELGPELLWDSFQSKNTVLWCLFIGTISSRERHQGKSNRFNKWFSERLLFGVYTMHLSTLQVLKARLFLVWYFEEMTPFLSRWYEMNAQANPERAQMRMRWR